MGHWLQLTLTDNLLEYFLGGGDNGGALPPTPEGEPLSNESSSAPSHRTFLTMQQQQQQGQLLERKAHTQFSMNNDQRNSNVQQLNTSSGFGGASISSSSNMGKEIQPPSTPAVQHFFARSSSSSTNSQQQTMNQQQQQPTQQSQSQSQTTTSNVGMNDILHFHQPSSIQQSQMHQKTDLANKQQRQTISMLYTSGSAHHVTSSRQSKNSNPSSSSSMLYQSTTGSSPLIVHQQFQQQQPLNQSLQSTAPGSFGSGISPISPAAMCTSEMMMLPPNSTGYTPTSTHHGNDATGTTITNNTTTQPSQWQQISHTQSTTSAPIMTQTQQQQHASWLQQVNKIAMNVIAADISNPTSNSIKQSNVTHNTSIHNAMSQPPQPQGTYYTTTTTQQTPAGNDATLAQHQQQQAQQIYVTSMAAHTQHGTISSDILPIPPTANPVVLSSVALHHFNTGTGATNAIETKEKRERRLARNRESARQSRRRKKELLINLEAQVNKLNTEIEKERQRQLMIMEREMRANKLQMLKNLFHKFRNVDDQGGDLTVDKTVQKEEEIKKVLDLIVRGGGPNLATRKATAEFQYRALKQLILPFYQRFFLSMSLRKESFFTGAKERRSKVCIFL